MTAATLDIARSASDYRPALPPIDPIRVPDAGQWTQVGASLRDPALRRRVGAALERFAHLAGAAGVDVVDRDFASVQAALSSAYDQLVELTGRCGVTVIGAADLQLLTEIAQLQMHVARAQLQQKEDRFAAVRTALSRLHGVDSTEQMLERASEELCRCGFDRAIISRVEESTWWVESVYVKTDPEWASEIARVGRDNPMHIDHLLVESELLRRRAPLLVRDAQQDPRTNPAIARASLSRSYVAAPIMPDGRVIGMLHADCYTSRRHVDEEDLAVLWMFAEGFGYAYQRTMLSERLRLARNQIQRMARDIASAADEVCTPETILCRQAPGTDASTPPPVAASLAANTSIETLLSRREIEIVSLMTQGMSNGAIATRLFISEGTVKTHVKHILRKLKASNRAEAVFRYMRMTDVHGSSSAMQHGR